VEEVKRGAAHWTVFALALLASATVAPASARADDGCLGSGTEATINAALVGAGAEAVLCPGAVFELHGPVVFRAPDQRLYTRGLPTDGTRAVLRIAHRDLTMAIDGNHQPGLVVENIQVDGDRPHLGFLSGPALLRMGWGGSNQTVQNIVAKNTRSWSTIHFGEGAVTGSVPQCQGGRIVGNQVGPAGSPDGTWADGISLACGNSLVRNNSVRDATDGAIVVFGAPGSLIEENTIIADTQQLLGGINMVDFGPVNGNYAGTRVRANVIDARNRFIKVAIGMGPQVWTCTTGTNVGGSVTNNTLRGLHMGYGYAVAGVRNWTVSGNVDVSRHVGRVGAGCAGTPSQPAGFQVQSALQSSLQSGFSPARLTYALGVVEPPILQVARPPAACTSMAADEGLYPGRSLSSCDGRFTLTLQGDGNLVLYQGRTALWQTRTTGKRSAVAIMQRDGNFVIYDETGTPIWATNTAGHPGASLWVQNDGNLVVYDPVRRPLWASHTCCR